LATATQPITQLIRIRLFDRAPPLLRCHARRRLALRTTAKTLLDVRVEQTLAQDALTDHARRSEENHFHFTISSSREGCLPDRVKCVE
jgi:hypothetical protein